MCKQENYICFHIFHSIVSNFLDIYCICTCKDTHSYGFYSDWSPNDSNFIDRTDFSSSCVLFDSDNRSFSRYLNCLRLNNYLIIVNLQYIE